MKNLLLQKRLLRPLILTLTLKDGVHTIAYKYFFLHLRTAIHACKQMGLDAKFDFAKKALETINLDLDLAKMEDRVHTIA